MRPVANMNENILTISSEKIIIAMPANVHNNAMKGKVIGLLRRSRRLRLVKTMAYRKSCMRPGIMSYRPMIMAMYDNTPAGYIIMNMPDTSVSTMRSIG